MLRRLFFCLLVFSCLIAWGCDEANEITGGNDFNSDNEVNLFINEFLAVNDACCVDESGEYDDWIELYNRSDESIDLSGYFLTDDLSDLQKFQIADGITIEPGVFLLFWADNDTEAGDFHCNFKISGGGEELGLYTSEGIPVDTLTFDKQSTDISYGRYPDGVGEWQFFESPTPGKSNNK